jgi:hypothetical protein
MATGALAIASSAKVSSWARVGFQHIGLLQLTHWADLIKRR